MQIRNNVLLLQCQKRQHIIGLWCNGNTTDSGPVIPSSNLGSPTKSRDIKSWLFCLYSFTYPPSEFRFAHLLIKPITASIRITIFKTIHLPFLLFSSESCILTTIFCIVPMYNKVSLPEVRHPLRTIPHSYMPKSTTTYWLKHHAVAYHQLVF